MLINQRTSSYIWSKILSFIMLVSIITVWRVCVYSKLLLPRGHTEYVSPFKKHTVDKNRDTYLEPFYQFKDQGHVACINSDFIVNRPVSVWTMLSDSKNYIKGAIKLGKSVLRHSTIPVDLNLMELSNKQLMNEDKLDLKRVGWKICTVNKIKPRNEARTYHRYQDQFTKLHLWNMTSYKTSIYLDSDTLVIGNIDRLLSMSLNSSRIGVTRGFNAGGFRDNFNMGVFLIHSNETEFKRLLALKGDPNVTFDTAMSEQAFLNVVYENHWQEIGFIYNANIGVFSQKKEYWNEFQKDIRVIHFTMDKPWQCSGKYSVLCDIWEKAP